MAIDGDASAVFAGGFDEIDAFVFGCGFGFLFSRVLDVLGRGGGAEVGEAVVEAIVVTVVDEEALGRSPDRVLLRLHKAIAESETLLRYASTTKNIKRRRGLRYATRINETVHPDNFRGTAGAAVGGCEGIPGAV